MQDLWKQTLGWDEDLLEELKGNCTTFSQILKQLETLQLKRNVCLRNPDKEIVIHGLSDASEKAYGACIYITTMDDNNVPSSSLLCSKSKVAPLKVITLPKLELCAAVLLSRLVANVVTALKLENVKINLLSDSAVTLYWIQTAPSNLKTCVANRVAETHELSQDYQRRHVPSAKILQTTSQEEYQLNSCSR